MDISTAISAISIGAIAWVGLSGNTPAVISDSQNSNTANVENATTDDFQPIISFVQRFEGDGAASKYDLGGKTRFGVTEQLWTSLGKPEPQTKEAAAEIFKEIYWDNGPTCKQYPKPVAFVCFDTSVNFGTKGNPPKTNGWASLSAGLDLKGDPNNSANIIIERRIAHRYAMVNRLPKQQVHLEGWLRRDKELKSLISGLGQ